MAELKIGDIVFIKEEFIPDLNASKSCLKWPRDFNEARGVPLRIIRGEEPESWRYVHVGWPSNPSWGASQGEAWCGKPINTWFVSAAHLKKDSPLNRISLYDLNQGFEK